MAALQRVIVFLAAHPVRVRAAVVSALTLVGVAFPALAGIETSEFVIGVILAALALALGQDASRKVERLPRPADRE